MDGIIDLGESIWVGFAAPGQMVLVADFDVLEVPRVVAAVPCAKTTPGAVWGAEEVL